MSSARYRCSASNTAASQYSLRLGKAFPEQAVSGRKDSIHLFFFPYLILLYPDVCLLGKIGRKQGVGAPDSPIARSKGVDHLPLVAGPVISSRVVRRPGDSPFMPFP
jgi:hypothetical protein